MKKLLLFCTLSLFCLSGCGVGPEIFISPIVTGVVIWIQGEAHKYYANDSDTLYRATKRSLNQLNIPIKRDDPPKDGNYYIIAGEGERFKIKIKRIHPEITKVSVRINIMGDKPYAELLYKQIDNQVRIIVFKDGKPVKNIDTSSIEESQ